MAQPTLGKLETVNLVGQDFDHGRVPLLRGFKLFQARGNVFMAGREFAHADAVQDRGEHCHAVRREDVRQVTAPSAAFV